MAQMKSIRPIITMLTLLFSALSIFGAELESRFTQYLEINAPFPATHTKPFISPVVNITCEVEFEYDEASVWEGVNYIYAESGWGPINESFPMGEKQTWTVGAYATSFDQGQTFKIYSMTAYHKWMEPRKITLKVTGYEPVTVNIPKGSVSDVSGYDNPHVVNINTLTPIDKYVHADGKDIKFGTDAFEFRGIGFTNFYDKDTLAKSHYNNFSYVTHHTQSDFDKVKELGFNSVRFALNGDWFEDGNVKDNSKRLWTWIDNSLRMADKAGLKVILEMHMPPGESWLDADVEKETPWDSPEWFWNKQNGYEEKLYDIWEAIAERYEHNPIVAAYGVLNEPKTTDLTFEQWFGKPVTEKGVAEKLIDAVRKHDNNHLIIIDNVVGSIKDLNDEYTGYRVWNEKFSDGNLMYDFHFYNPGPFTHQGATWGGSMSDGSVYPDPLYINTKDFWAKGTAYATAQDEGMWKGDWSNVTSSEINKWTTYTTPALTATSETKFVTASLLAKGHEAGKDWDALFDNIVLLKKSSTDADFKPVRKYEISQGWADESVKSHSQGFYPNSSDKSKFFLSTTDGSNLNGTTDSYSLGITNATDASWGHGLLTIVAEANCQYKLQADIKVVTTAADLPASLVVTPLMGAYKDGESAIKAKDIGRNIDRLEDNLYKVQWANQNNVPVSCLEFGLMEGCFGKRATDGVTDIGGEQWMDDVAALFKKHDVQWAFWAYRNLFMGIYKGVVLISEDTGEEYSDESIYINKNDETQKNPGLYEAAIRLTAPVAAPAFKMGTAYAAGEQVSYNDKAYEATVEITSADWIPPMAIHEWERLGKVYKEEWALSNMYEVDDVVLYNGQYYVCIQRHSSHSSQWTPDATPALWTPINE